MKPEKKTTWGGARRGAGRKPLPKRERRVGMELYLSEDVRKFLEAEAASTGRTTSQVANQILERSRSRRARRC